MNRTIRGLCGDSAYILTSTFYHPCIESFEIWFLSSWMLNILQTRIFEHEFYWEKKFRERKSLLNVFLKQAAPTTVSEF